MVMLPSITPKVARQRISVTAVAMMLDCPVLSSDKLLCDLTAAVS